MSMIRPTILTVHGINTDGQWQNNVKHVLEPHFVCKAVRYSHYRYFGALKLIVEPWVLLPSLGLLLLAWNLGELQKPIYWFAGVVVLSHAASYVRRQRALKSCLKQVNHDGYEQRRNLIAHSLGTYLAGRIIRKHAWFRLSHVVFAGSVLSRRFGWRGLVGSKVDPEVRFDVMAQAASTTPGVQVIKVRNEVQRRDMVPILAGALRSVLLPDFGMAGYVGFQETVPCPPNAKIIHNIPRPDASCDECKKANSQVPVHNVTCAEYCHSDIFGSPGYVAYFWLPFFWNIAPPEYSRFVDLCLAAARAEVDKDWVTVLKKEKELRDCNWGWSRRRLTTLVKVQIKASFSAKQQISEWGEPLG